MLQKWLVRIQTQTRSLTCRRQLHAPKSKEFYEEQNILRRYFYIIDTKGQVFQEATKHRNFVSSMKDVAFLNMLHSLLRPNTSGLFPEYPLFFPCGKEHNYVVHEDQFAVLGFSKLVSKDQKLQVCLGGSSILQEFDPSSLYCCPNTGRFYHIIQNHKYLKNKLGLLHPQVSESLSGSIRLCDSGDYFEYTDNHNRHFKIQDIDSFKEG